jgi:thiol-disulfide isomerase/thioredoxin
MTPARRRWLLAGAGAVALAAGAGVALFRTRVKHGAAHEVVAALFRETFPDAQGVPQAMAQWRDRWLVLNFWATWCAPCVEEMPTLQAVARDYAARNVSVVGLGIDRPEAIRRFQADLKLDLPLLVAGVDGTRWARDLGNPSGALPYTVLISPAGGVVQARLGLLQPALLRGWLDTRV